MQFLSALAFVFLSTCALLPQTRPVEVGEDATQPALEATVALVGDLGQTYCSGVLHRGIVITANHCVDHLDDPEHSPGLNIVLRSDESELIPAEVLRNDFGHDVALVRATDRVLPDGLVLAASPPGYGEGVVVIGHPYGLRWSMVNGIVSHPRREGGPMPTMLWVQISSPVSPGNSGGPVLNGRAEIVGIVSFIVNSDSHLAGAVHLEAIQEVLSEVH